MYINEPMQRSGPRKRAQAKARHRRPQEGRTRPTAAGFPFNQLEYSRGPNRLSTHDLQKVYKHKSAYFNFLIDFRGQNYEGSQTEIARCAGRYWRQLTSEQKRPYQEAARANRVAQRTAVLKRRLRRVKRYARGGGY